MNDLLKLTSDTAFLGLSEVGCAEIFVPCSGYAWVLRGPCQVLYWA